MQFTRFTRRLSLYAFLLGFVFACAAAFVLAAHVRSFAEQKQRALAIGVELPVLRSRVALLKASLATEKAYGMDAAASLEEQAALSVLPITPDAPRFIAMLTSVVAAIDTGLSVERVVFGQETVEEGRKRIPVTLSLSGPFSAVTRLLSILRLSGKLTVSDLLQSDAEKRFLDDVDARSPASLLAASQFLSSDILSVAAQPEAALDRVTHDMPSSLAADVRAILLSSGLAPVFDVLSPIVQSFSDTGNWPLPLFTLDTVERTGDRTVIHLTMVGRKGE